MSSYHRSSIITILLTPRFIDIALNSHICYTLTILSQQKGAKTIKVAGTKLYNSLPWYITDSLSLNTFKNRL